MQHPGSMRSAADVQGGETRRAGKVCSSIRLHEFEHLKKGFQEAAVFGSNVRKIPVGDDRLTQRDMSRKHLRSLS
jgi:hypothetical protein